MRIKLFTKGTIVIMLLTVVVPAAFAGNWNTNKNNIVLDGFDVVAYFTEDKAKKGSAKYRVNYDKVTFYFSSKQNQEMFRKNPRQYLPKYNGYCAFAVGAKNAKVPANPDTFKLYNGNLLVFFNDTYEGQKVNTKIPWNGDEKHLFTAAEKNWSTLRKQ